MDRVLSQSDRSTVEVEPGALVGERAVRAHLDCQVRQAAKRGKFCN